jgi:hypothetical protein
VALHGRELCLAMATRVLFLLILLAPLSAQPSSRFQDLAQELAARILAAVGHPDQVSLTVASNVDGDDASLMFVDAEIRRALTASGFRVVNRSDAAGDLLVGCSTNLRDRACVAQLHRAGVRSIVVVTRPLESSRERPLSLAIELLPVFAQRTPILDVAVAGDRLLVLDPERVALYTRAEAARERWTLLQSFPTANSRPWPRDIRGRLQLENGTVTAWLPGVVCRASADLARHACTDERQSAWPLGIENTGIDTVRNFFYTPEGLPFYSAAALGADADARWIVVSKTGELLLLDTNRRAAATGIVADDVAGVDASCAGGAYALSAASGNDESRFDVLRLWKIVQRQLLVAAPPIQLQGRLTALWSEQGSHLLTAVAHDPAQERYEAFQIRLACSGS